MTPFTPNFLSASSLTRGTLVARIIEEFVDIWIMHAFLLPTNLARQDYKTETIQKLLELIQMFEELDFSRFSLTEWDVLDNIEEEKSSD